MSSGKDRGATVNGGDRERTAFVEQVRHENEKDFGPSARRAVDRMLAAGHPHLWAYVLPVVARVDALAFVERARSRLGQA